MAPPAALAAFTPGADLAETNRVTTNWHIQTAAHGPQKATDLALTQEVKATVDEHYYASLNHPETGYSEVDCMDTLTHLRTRYGAMRDKDIIAYNETIKEKWDK
jgi:hypothetical protein